MTETKRKPRESGQLVGMAGEFLTAGKLFKRGYQVAVTMGNAKHIDLFVSNSKGNTFKVQVKTARGKYDFFCRKEEIKGDKDQVYVFVTLNEPSEPEEFFILPGESIKKDMNKFFGVGGSPKSVSGILRKQLPAFKDNWKVFDG